MIIKAVLYYPFTTNKEGMDNLIKWSEWAGLHAEIVFTIRQLRDYITIHSPEVILIWDIRDIDLSEGITIFYMVAYMHKMKILDLANFKLLTPVEKEINKISDASFSEMSVYDHFIKGQLHDILRQ